MLEEVFEGIGILIRIVVKMLKSIITLEFHLHSLKSFIFLGFIYKRV